MKLPFINVTAIYVASGGQLDGQPAIGVSHRTLFDNVWKSSQAKFTFRAIRL